MYSITKEMLLDAVRHLPRTIYNLLLLEKNKRNESQESLIRDLVLSMPPSDREPFAAECQFVRDLPLDRLRKMVFPYGIRTGSEDIFDDSNIKTGRDKGLPFVVHHSGRRVYFPRVLDEATMLESYKDLVYVEGITGHGILEKSPHCYQDAEFSLEDGDCILDIGCAEALFTVENMDRISKGIVFECESAWSRPLAATFQDCREKIRIVEKTVSDKTSKKTTRIMDAIAGFAAHSDKFFVKMDIEGGERSVIMGNADFFRTNKVKLSCCVYHRQDDAVVIKEILEKLGYTTRFSDGYMLIGLNGIHFPYFRRGVIYAWNH